MFVQQIDWQRLSDLGSSEVLTELGPARVAMLIRGRNAWHCTRVRHYQGPTAMYTTARSAQLAAERRRERGSYFYVIEVPALVLRGFRFTALQVEFRPRDPFRGYLGVSQGQLLPGERMTSAIRMLGNRSGLWAAPVPGHASLRTGQVNDARNLLPLGVEPLRSFHSVAQGSGHLLGWRPIANDFLRDGLEKLVHDYRALTAADLSYAALLEVARSIEDPLPEAPMIFGSATSEPPPLGSLSV